MQVNVVSFGYKHGLPLDVDLVFDCRFLPNPHWVDELRPLTGLDAPVRDYVLGQPDTQAFLEELRRLFELTRAPAFEREGQVVPLDRRRLHGWPAPQRRHRRDAGPPPRWSRHGYHRYATRDVERV